MGKKGRKTRWRKLPIPIGEGTSNFSSYAESGQKDEVRDVPEHNHKPTTNISSPTFNNDEYTKITAPRQDMLFKKGSFVKKKSNPSPPQDTTETQSAGSMESDQYACEEQPPQYPYNGYVEPTGSVYYMNNSYEMYDPYYGNVTVVVGPPAQFGPGPHPMLAAVPCQPVPLQPLEWFNPAAPQPPYCLPLYPSKKKKSSLDSQSCSRQSSESTLPPGSPQESIESPEQSGMYMQQYMYPGYMFGAPLYNVNGVSVQGVVLPPAPQQADQSKRRKKRKRRMRGAVADEGSESSYEEVLSCEAGGGSQSGASSDTAPGSSSSKTTSDSGVTTDLLANSGSNSPQPTSDPPMTPDHFTTLSIANSQEIIDTLRPYETLLHPDNTDDQICSPEPLLNNNPGSDVELLFHTDEPCDDNLILNVQNQEEAVHACDNLNNIENKYEELSSPVLTTENEIQSDFVEYEEPQLNFDLKTPCNGHITLSEDFPLLEEEHVKSETIAVYEDFAVFPEETQETSINVICNELETVTLSEETDEKDKEFVIKDDLNHKIDAIIESLLVKNETVDEQIPKIEISSENTSECENVINRILDVTEVRIKESSPERPITDAVTKWLQTKGSSPLLSPNDSTSEDEGIEEGEEVLTGQKNGEGNPFLAPSPSGSRTRVANDIGIFVSSAGIWDENRVTEMCDPKASVNKYYRLAAEVPLDKNPCLMKTAVHIGRSGPFPCGVCCIIQ